jgi:hypothetical protein
MKTFPLITVTCLAVGSFPSVSSAQQAAPPAAPPAGQVSDEQPRTLLSGQLTHGGFGGPMMAYTRINGDDALVMGGRGGWLINHRLVIGGGGWGVTNRVSVPAGAIADPKDYQLTFGYGGLWTEYVVAPSRLVHGSVGTLIGAGGLGYHRFRNGDSHADMESDAVFVLEPTVGAELNLISFMRLALFASYRLVRGVDLAELDGGDLSGFAGGAMLKFGKF